VKPLRQISHLKSKIGDSLYIRVHLRYPRKKWRRVKDNPPDLFFSKVLCDGVVNLLFLRQCASQTATDLHVGVGGEVF
jgi:hypothetical protein